MFHISDFDDMGPFVALRRDIHAHPELGFEEHRTASLVADRLRQWGIEVHTGIAGTGVVGVLRQDGPRSIGLRADPLAWWAWRLSPQVPRNSLPFCAPIGKMQPLSSKHLTPRWNDQLR